MRKNRIEEIVLGRMQAGWHENTDCSEIADDLQEMIGGDILTLVRVRFDGLIVPIKCILGTQGIREYKYHCVLAVDTTDAGKVIIDVLADEFVMPITKYMNELRKRNGNTLLVKVGDWANAVMLAIKIGPNDGFDTI